jgi:hypothetical protein
VISQDFPPLQYSIFLIVKIQNRIKSVFSVALPPKKHRPYEPSEYARRGEMPKRKVLAIGDQRAQTLPRRFQL